MLQQVMAAAESALAERDKLMRRVAELRGELETAQHHLLGATAARDAVEREALDGDGQDEDAVAAIRAAADGEMAARFAVDRATRRLALANDALTEQAPAIGAAADALTAGRRASIPQLRAEFHRRIGAAIDALAGALAFGAAVDEVTGARISSAFVGNILVPRIEPEIPYLLGGDFNGRHIATRIDEFADAAAIRREFKPVAALLAQLATLREAPPVPAPRPVPEPVVTIKAPTHALAPPTPPVRGPVFAAPPPGPVEMDYITAARAQGLHSEPRR